MVFFESLFGQSAAHGAFTGMGSEGNAQDFAMRGKDQRVLVTITLEEAFHGARQALHLNRPVADAAGHLSMQPQQLKVAIPKGIVEGQRIRLEGRRPWLALPMTRRSRKNPKRVDMKVRLVNDGPFTIILENL